MDDQRTDSAIAGEDGRAPEVRCSLSADDAETRLAWVESEVLPHLVAVRHRDDGFTAEFERSPEAFHIVANLAWKESRCCPWATFEIEVPPRDAPIAWRGRTDRAHGLDLFETAIENLEVLADVDIDR